MITTTLKRIQEHCPCGDGWKKLLKGLGKKKADGEPLSFATILEINGLDAFWCCRVEPQYAKEWRLFAVTCARRVEHLNPDPRVKNVIDVAERYANGQATYKELITAGDAARDAGAEGDAAWAVWAASAAAWATAWAAELPASRVAAAAAEAAEATAGAAAGDAEREWQTQEFLRVITETELRQQKEGE